MESIHGHPRVPVVSLVKMVLPSARTFPQTRRLPAMPTMSFLFTISMDWRQHRHKPSIMTRKFSLMRVHKRKTSKQAKAVEERLSTRWTRDLLERHLPNPPGEDRRMKNKEHNPFHTSQRYSLSLLWPPSKLTRSSL